MNKYVLEIEPGAQKWLDNEPLSISGYVRRVLDSICNNPHAMGEMVRNQALFRPGIGQPYRFKVKAIYPEYGGVRIIYYVIDEPSSKVIIFKIALRDEDPYQNGG